MKTRHCFCLKPDWIYVVLIILFLPVISVAQDHYYYSNQQKIYVDKPDHWVSVMIPEQQHSLLISRIEQDAQVHVRQTLDTERGVYWIETKHYENVMDDLARLSLLAEGIQTFPVYYYVATEQDTTWFATTDEFRVRFEEHTTEDKIRQLLETYRAEVVRISEFGRYTLRIAEDAPYNTLETANRFYEHAETVWSLPNFHMKIQSESIQDPLFNNQWHLRNTGQSGAVSGVDINAVFAWDITTGSDDIIVAVIDNGVEDHEDFSQGQLINGVTAGPTQGVGGPVNDEVTHGQAVSGIIAADHNTIGVRGVSSNVRIMPINIFDDEADNEDIADAIDWAWQNGTDVLNNSWGCNFQGCFDDDIAEAIERALTQGRNDRGAIVLKSAGNNGQFVTFPGTVPGVFVVGAVSSQNQKLGYSPESDLIDIIAPSGDRFDSNNLDIVTMNREGQNGYEDGTDNQVVTQDGNYLLSFDGTSAAVAQTTGVAALMLSVNPDLEARSVGGNHNPELQNILRNTATSYGSTDWAGHGRLNAYEAVKAAMPQFTNHSFTSSTTLTQFMYLNGNSTLANGATLTIPEGIGVVVDGNFSSTGSSTLLVEGNLVLEQGASLNSIELSLEESGRLVTKNNVFFDMNAAMLTADGTARFGSGFTMKDGIMDIGEDGSVEFEGSALLEFIEVPVATMPGGPTLYMMPRMNIRGTFTSSLPQNIITLRLSPNSTFSEWNGITVFNSSQGSQLWGLTIEDAKTGIHLSSVDDIHLLNVEIESPSDAGIVSMGSNPSAAGVHVTNSGGVGVDISGGNPEIGYFDATGNSESGVRSRSYASTYMPEGSVSGSGAGPSYAGVWVENASHTHINGTIGSVSGWQAAAVNDAWAYFNGTTWAGGTPYTHVDGSSQLYVYNPNNPQKTMGGRESLQAQLLREWSERYRESRGEAVSWLTNERSSMAEAQQAVASILLADHYIAVREYDQAGIILTEASASSYEDALAPGALAQRKVLLAVHGPENESLGRSSISALRQSEADSRHLRLLEQLIDSRYGPEDEQGIPGQPLAETSGQFELANYPNPFNPVTVIHYQLPVNSEVRLEVFDMLGRRVALLADGMMEAGSHEVTFDASNIASGVYLYRLTAGSTIKSRKLTLMK